MSNFGKTLREVWERAPEEYRDVPLVVGERGGLMTFPVELVIPVEHPYQPDQKFLNLYFSMSPVVLARDLMMRVQELEEEVRDLKAARTAV